MSRFTALPLPSRASDLSALLTSLDTCLALADKLDLPRIAIDLEQARCRLMETGCDAKDGADNAPKSFAPSTIDPLS